VTYTKKLIFNRFQQISMRSKKYTRKCIYNTFLSYVLKDTNSVVPISQDRHGREPNRNDERNKKGIYIVDKNMIIILI